VHVRPDDSDGWGLRGADLTLAPGQHLALLGRSGSGKTTIAELLVRFLDPDRGRARLSGADLRTLAQRDLRARVTLDRQDAYLFASTIRENVRLARPGADDAAVETALRRAGLGDWVAGLPAGLDTPVGEEGAAVSGGERRRLTLARAFLADTPVLVLDEPTAHLDRATATALMTDLMSATGDRAVLLITHRPEEAALTHGVVRLQRGRIVAEPIRGG
jgi:ABC-type multidrug transport system fused ATPase/permease subunit